MSDARQLPFLLRLFDDPSPVVQEAVRQRLRAMAAELPALLDALDPPVDPELRRSVLAILPDPPSRRTQRAPKRRKALHQGAAPLVEVEEGADVQSTRFLSGQVVRHRRYGYRGLVVHCDLQCRASEEWYRSNPSQPDRNQPWYHVLVDGSDQITYVAESNLHSESGEDEVRHPLVTQYFHRRDGRYQRNDRPWPREG